jgi:hypothetical protein
MKKSGQEEAEEEVEAEGSGAAGVEKGSRTAEKVRMHNARTRKTTTETAS